MKTTFFKKVLALLLTAAMLCSFGVTALAGAEELDSVTPTVTIEAPELVKAGTEVTAKATVVTNAPDGWEAAITYGWAANGSGAVSFNKENNKEQYTITVDDTVTFNVSVTVQYTKKDEQPVTKVAVASKEVKAGYPVTVTNDTGYTIKLSPAPGADNLLAKGTQVTATVEAAQGYKLNDPITLSPASPYTVTGETTFTATAAEGKPVAEPKTLTIEYTVIPQEGVTPPAVEKTVAKYGEEAKFPVVENAKDNKGNTYKLVWYYNDAAVTGLTADQVKTEIEAGKTSLTIAGSWQKVEPTEVTVTLPESGTGYTVAQTSEVKEKYKEGEKITFTVTAKEGYKLAADLNATADKGTVEKSVANPTATFTYTVGKEAAVITLSEKVVEKTKVTLTFDMNTKNDGKLKYDGTAKPASIESKSLEYVTLTTQTLTKTATLTTDSRDGGAVYQLAGWKCGTTNYNFSVTGDQIRALVKAAKKQNEDCELKFTAVWESAIDLQATLDYNFMSLAMTEPTDADYYSLASQMRTQAPDNAEYIVFTSLGSSSYGTLYEDDSLRYEVSTRNSYYYLDGARGTGINYFSDLVFVPYESASNVRKNYVASFDVYNAKNEKIASGKLTINTGDDADIVWTMDGSDSIQFDEDDFYDFYRSASRSNVLDCVTFETGFTMSKANGYLCYGGTASADQLTDRILAKSEYYYDSSSSRENSLSELYYVMGTDDKGFRAIYFTCYDSTGKESKAVDGVLVIRLEETSGSAGEYDLMYNVKYTDTMDLNGDDFYYWAGSDLSYIVFDKDDIWDMSGTFNVGSGRSVYTLGDDLDEDTRFYLDASAREYSIDDLYYEPRYSTRYSHSVDEVRFTAYNKNGRVIEEGVMAICVVADDVPQITLNVNPSKNVAFTATAFKNAASKAVNSSTGIDSIVLNNLPSTGTLYHDKTKATVGTTYSLGTTGSKLVSKLNYTATAKNGRYNVSYCAYDGQKLLFVGNLVLEVGDNSIAAGNIYAVGSQLPASTIIKEAEKILDKDFAYLTVEQPTNAIVYENYTAINKHGGAASATTKYYEKATSSQAAIANLVVVPYADLANSAKIDVTVVCYDKNQNATKLTVRFTYVKAATTAIKFNDVVADWYKDSIYFLNSNGIVDGVSTTKYGVGTNIKRGDFILMLYRAFDLGSLTKTVGSFADVGDVYYANAIGVAKTLGIANGYNVNGSSYFYPEKSITREEAFTLLYRTLSLSGIKSKLASSLPAASSSALSSFSDRNSIQSFAKDAVSVLVKAEIVKGSDGKIKPGNPISREEMAVILHRALTRY